MTPLKTKLDLVELTGMSKDYWDDLCSRRKIPFTMFGNKIRFTDEQVQQIIDSFAKGPKRVPTRAEVAATRQRRAAA